MSFLSRRDFLATAAVLPYSVKAFAADAATRTSYVYFGTDTETDDKSSQGVYMAQWNPATGHIGPLKLAVATSRPTFLAQHGRYVYVLDELNEVDGTLGAYTRAHDGSLHEVNTVKVNGIGSCFVAIHPSGKAAYVANYAGGNISSFRIGADGRLSECVFHEQYKGHGPHLPNQAGPHAHSTVVSPDGLHLLVNDLGLDGIHIYEIDPKDPAELTTPKIDIWRSAEGAGPRHLAFSPNGHFAYDVNELNSTINVLEWDRKAGTLTTLGDAVSTLPAGFQGKSSAAEILVSPDGRFVYTSNRGDDSVTVFAVSADGRTLTQQQRISVEGKTPRHMTLSPDARWLVAANQNSSNVIVYRRNAKTGGLTKASTAVVPHPMYVLFAKG